MAWMPEDLDYECQFEDIFNSGYIFSPQLASPCGNKLHKDGLVF